MAWSRPTDILSLKDCLNPQVLLVLRQVLRLFKWANREHRFDCLPDNL